MTQRFACYEDLLASALVPVRIATPDRQALRAAMTRTTLGAVDVFRNRGGGHRTMRGAREIARSSDECFNLLINLASSWNVEHRGRVRLGPCDAILSDTNETFVLDFASPYDVINLKLPKTWLMQWLPTPSMLVGRHIPADSVWGRALTSFAAQLSPEFVANAPLPHSFIADHLGALLALVADQFIAEPQRSNRAGMDLRERIQDVIQQRCTDMSLTAADVAASLNISVRTLHRKLSAFGETFGALLIGARADVAVRMLESRHHAHLSAAEIGRRAGFADPSHFTRVLRSRVGRTPSRIRCRRR